MGTKFKTPQEKFEYRFQKDKSVEKQVFVFTKKRKTWEEGISFRNLKEKIELSLKKEFCDGRIYEAISLLNRYGKVYGIYLRSAYGWIEDKNNKRKVEYRYFVPTESFDIQREKGNLEHRKEIIVLKEGNLEYHEKVTIPQEQKIAQIQR